MSDAALTDTTQDERRAGLLAVTAAYATWGFLPIFLKLLSFADPREVLAQRILWGIPAALLAVFLISGWRRGLKELASAFKPRMLGTLAASAVFIFFNWGIYVWLVMQSRIMEAALAYFIAPLVAVAVGVFFFKERSSNAQFIAIALAAIGVVIQGVALGAPPWMALALCATWSAYAVIRKSAPVPSATGLFIETLALAPVAAGLLFWTAGDTQLGFSMGWGQAILLALSGPITALPLMLFAFGARRVTFTATGLLQFLAPSLQFITGLAFGESFTPLRAISFAIIWAGLAFFVWDAVSRARRA
jgi:chloramphenicol-sensitive protein RarD